MKVNIQKINENTTSDTIYKKHPKYDLILGTNGACFSLKKGKLIIRTNDSGRPITEIKRGKSKFIHRLIWETFIGPIPHGLVINHKDCCVYNNDIKNLEVVTYKENSIHASNMGRFKNRSGTNSPSAKVTIEVANELIHMRKNKKKYKEMESFSNLCRCTIRKIISGKHFILHQTHNE